MTNPTRIGAAALAVALGIGTLAPRPAAADGAASTRNIIFGAAAIGGTLLILNHNKKVHEKYAEYDRQQAQLQSQRNDAQAAYASERDAYNHQVAINQEYQKEVSYQHQQVVAMQREISQLRHEVSMAKVSSASQNTAFVRTVRAPSQSSNAASTGQPRPVQTVAYGWGTL